MPLACSGCKVTLLNPSRALLEGAAEIWRAAKAPEPELVVADPEGDSPTEPSAYDLVWSFCAFEHARVPDRLAAAMVRASRRHILVFVQNAWMPGVHIHRLHHRLQSKPWDHGRLRSMRAETVGEHLERAGARVISFGGCDLPPWPDIDVRLPRLRRRGPSLRAAPRPYGPGDAVMKSADAADVLRRPARLSRPMQWLADWHDRVETALPKGVLRWIAHHPYVLAEKA